jgi:carbohydrate-binding DOMON domain-containing protein
VTNTAGPTSTPTQTATATKTYTVTVTMTPTATGTVLTSTVTKTPVPPDTGYSEVVETSNSTVPLAPWLRYPGFGLVGLGLLALVFGKRK